MADRREVLDGAPPANTLPVVVEGVPGLHLRYSGGGTTIAQKVVTDVVGKPFPDLMRELVLEPAGMSNSTFEQPLPAAIAERAASGHPWNGVPVASGWHVYPEMAAAGLWTTAGDLARLGAELMRTLNGAESALDLGRETVAAMLRPQVPGLKIGDDFPGLGWFCSGEGEAFRFGQGGQDWPRPNSFMPPLAAPTSSFLCGTDFEHCGSEVGRHRRKVATVSVDFHSAA